MSLARRVADRYRNLVIARRVVADLAKLSYHPAARREFEEAIAWYDTEASKLGLEFAEDVVGRVRTIREFPERYPRIMGGRGARTAPVDPLQRRWPYSIVYQAIRMSDDEPRVRVLAVAHAKRRPRYWLNRK